MTDQPKETTAATVVLKESLQGKRNTETAIELYQLIDDRDFNSAREITNIMFAIAMHRQRYIDKVNEFVEAACPPRKESELSGPIPRLWDRQARQTDV